MVLLDILNQVSQNQQLYQIIVKKRIIVIDAKNKIHQKMKCKLDLKKLHQNSMLYNFSMHISCLNPFENKNQFQLIAANLINKRKTLNQTNELTVKENNNIKQFADITSQRILNYSIEESIRIFITYGHLVIDTQVISTNQLLQQEKCFAIIDMDKRTLVKENEIIQQNKKPQNLKQVNSSFEMKTILSQITNQKVSK